MVSHPPKLTPLLTHFRHSALTYNFQLLALIAHPTRFLVIILHQSHQHHRSQHRRFLFLLPFAFFAFFQVSFIPFQAPSVALFLSSQRT